MLADWKWYECLSIDCCICSYFGQCFSDKPLDCVFMADLLLSLSEVDAEVKIMTYVIILFVLLLCSV